MRIVTIPRLPGHSFAGSIAQLGLDRRLDSSTLDWWATTLDSLLDWPPARSRYARQLAGSTAPGMPKRPPVSSRGTQTAPGQLAGLLVAPRPLYGHAGSSQPAHRCSTGQLHSIAGASFPGLPARLPVRPAAHSISSRAPGAIELARRRPR